jgi:hypothetical protein
VGNGRPGSGGPFTVVGGGISNAGTLTLQHSTVAANFADNFGGGIYNATGSTLLITQSAVVDNSMGQGDGGGIFNDGLLFLTNSTLANNLTLANHVPGGAGLRNNGTAWLTNTTITGNHNNPFPPGVAAASGPRPGARRC